MLELILTVAAVVTVSSLCSMSEAVLYSVPASHIESLVHAGSKRGQILQNLRRNIDRPIAALLSLNTIANTAGAAAAGALAAQVLGTRWIVLFSAGITLLILFVAEIIPKTAGVIHCRALSVHVARPLHALVWLLSPLVWTSGWITRRMTAGRRMEDISQAEIIMMTRLGLQKGVIDEDEAKVIHNILSLGTRTVRDVLTPRTVLFALPGDLTVGEARRERGLLTHSRIPVYFKNLDEIGGIVHRRDVLTAVAEDRFEKRIEQLMKPVHFVSAKMRLNRALKLFLNRGEHLFVVVDEFGGTSGVVTLEDILEEILGREIVDEFDEVADLREMAQRRRRQALDADASRWPPEAS